MKKTKFKDGGFLNEKSLNKIKQKVGKRKLIIHRNTGVGKSYFASKNDKTIFLKINNINTDEEWEKLVDERKKRKEKFWTGNK
jgi:hypothetical protein